VAQVAPDSSIGIRHPASVEVVAGGVPAADLTWAVDGESARVQATGPGRWRIDASRVLAPTRILVRAGGPGSATAAVSLVGAHLWSRQDPNDLYQSRDRDRDDRQIVHVASHPAGRGLRARLAAGPRILAENADGTLPAVIERVRDRDEVRVTAALDPEAEGWSAWSQDAALSVVVEDPAWPGLSTTVAFTAVKFSRESHPVAGRRYAVTAPGSAAVRIPIYRGSPGREHESDRYVIHNEGLRNQYGEPLAMTGTMASIAVATERVTAAAWWLDPRLGWLRVPSTGTLAPVSSETTPDRTKGEASIRVHHALSSPSERGKAAWSRLQGMRLTGMGRIRVRARYGEPALALAQNDSRALVAAGVAFVVRPVHESQSRRIPWVSVTVDPVPVRTGVTDRVLPYLPSSAGPVMSVWRADEAREGIPAAQEHLAVTATHGLAWSFGPHSSGATLDHQILVGLYADAKISIGDVGLSGVSDWDLEASVEAVVHPDLGIGDEPPVIVFTPSL
jgi:hypothetical protein